MRLCVCEKFGEADFSRTLRPFSLTLAAETLKMATCGKAPFEFTRQLGQSEGPERGAGADLLEQRAKRGVAAAEERSGRDSECVACLRDTLSRPLLACAEGCSGWLREWSERDGAAVQADVLV